MDCIRRHPFLFAAFIISVGALWISAGLTIIGVYS